MTRLRAAGPARAAVSANPMLDWDDLGLLARHPLITLGAHTVSHPSLRALAAEDAAREIEESRRVLERRCGTKVAHLAYPFGSRAQVGPREADLSAQAGLRSAFTALEGHLHDGHARQPFLLPRFPVTRRDGVLGVRFKLSGWRALLQNRGERLITI
jgi:peptidoglycan/xylan/chitin deacetylase (PgdA/CDA1 family)